MSDEVSGGDALGPADSSAAGAASGETNPNATADVRRAVQAASGWVLICAVVGVVLGLVWIALAPRVTLTVTDDGITEDRGAASVPFDADLLLGGLLLVAGVVLSVVWLSRGSRFPTAAVIGLVLGGLLAGGIAMAMAAILTEGGTPASELPVGSVVDVPLRMRSWPMLLWWPAAVLVVAALNSLRSESEPDPLPASSPAT